MSALLNGKTFVLELGREIRFKTKQELIKYLQQQNAHISFILTASTDYVLVSNDVDTYKTRRAKQLGIPLIHIDYIYQCRNSLHGKDSIDIKRFIVTSAEDKENFSKTGILPVTGGATGSISSIKTIRYDLSKIKIWNSDDADLPKFDELTHSEIAKWAIFKETTENFDAYFALELQILPEQYYDQTKNDYRSRFRYEKQTITNTKGKISLIQYAFSHDINELHQLFASYYNRIATMPRITRIRDLLPDKFGSKLLLRSLFFNQIDTQTLDDDVCQLIESLWIESIGDLDKILSVKPESIPFSTIIEAEAALLEIKSNNNSASGAQSRFYSLIPHQPAAMIDLIQNRRALVDKIDLCQMLRDLLTVNELTNWNIKASVEAKYRALKCHIEAVNSDSSEYRTINDMISSSSSNETEQIIVHKIYSVAKQTDALNFRSTLFNQKQLFHGSKYNNFLGILSRGLLMPKMVVDDLGITRTDFGCLGYGLYYSDSILTSLKYTTPSTTRPDRRLLCISQVALGESAKYYSYAPKLTQPPENYHSTHGVKRNDENKSKFIDDEFAIYNLDQQKLLYLIEVSWLPYDDPNRSRNLLPIVRENLSSNSIIQVEKDIVNIPTTIEDETIKIAEQDYGLICPSSGQLVPLKAFHVRAQLVDVTAEVILYQVYHNTSSVPIEAKYVFPLDENCSVCGFEAHINNKVIKGVVKEKEQAKREYREAIEKGHGAYLMHQEQPEVFSVSVGNLPANCEVIIKITYVAELAIENHDIIFRLPAKVASWQSKHALNMKDQAILPSINLGDNDSSMKSVEFSLRASIRMPYEITKLFSPTHRLRRKITDCIAMIEFVDNILIEKDFILSITLKSVHLPRMLNETYDIADENNNDESQACMLTFYPKFDFQQNPNEFIEIIFIIDVSNSMDGKHVQQAKQLTHLFLTSMKIDDGNLHFNVITFGSDNYECFPISSPNTKDNIDKAKHFVLHSLDHRGNTDLFSVLRQYSLLPSSSKLGRQFILISDGHVNDLKSILQLFESQSTMRHDRFFACSIGDTSNKHNLRQLANGANAGGLTMIFDSNYRSRWKTKVIEILERVHQPCVTNISVDWQGTIDNRPEIFTNQAPKIIRSLFSGMRLTVYRFIKNCHKATLTATINNQQFETTVFSNKITETRGRILHCLTARAIIHDYENGLFDSDESENELMKIKYKQDLIELSMKYSVVSSFTSFVAIEERDGKALQPGVRIVDVLLKHDIDLLPYISWDGDRSQIDILKEKLHDAKRLFDSSSITNKLNLAEDYEKLCQSVSYRSGGDAKYNLMLTIIDTYKATLDNRQKARDLEEQMLKDLTSEISNATVDEKETLETKCDEIMKRVYGNAELDDSPSRSLSDYNEDCELFDEICFEEHIALDQAEIDGFCDNLRFHGSSGEDEISMMRREEEESEESVDMGFGLFDDSICTYSPRKKLEEKQKNEEITLIPSQQRSPKLHRSLRLADYAAPIEKADDKAFNERLKTTTQESSMIHSTSMKTANPFGGFSNPPEQMPLPLSNFYMPTGFGTLTNDNNNNNAVPSAHLQTDSDLLDLDCCDEVALSPMYSPISPSAMAQIPLPPTVVQTDPFSTFFSDAESTDSNSSVPPQPAPSFPGFASAFSNASRLSLPRLPARIPAVAPSSNCSTFTTRARSSETMAPVPPPPPPPPPPPSTPMSLARSTAGGKTADRRSELLTSIYQFGKKASETSTSTSMLQLCSRSISSSSSPEIDTMTPIRHSLMSRCALVGSAIDENVQHKEFKHVPKISTPSINFKVHHSNAGVPRKQTESEQIYRPQERSIRRAKRQILAESASPDKIEDKEYFTQSSVRDLLLLEVVPLGFGIEDINGQMCTLVCRNQTIPLRTTFNPTFTNAYAYQKTANIRVFCGEHKLTKYNKFVGEFILDGLASNFGSQTLEISISMDIDANSILTVHARESKSGATAKMIFTSNDYSFTKDEIERHITYVRSDPDFQSQRIEKYQSNNTLYMLKGDTETSKRNFTGDIEVSNNILSAFNKIPTIALTTTVFNELERILLANGSFDLNQDLANLLSIPIKYFDNIISYLNSQGFRSFASNVQINIIHLIATGIILIQLLLQVPKSELNAYLTPFDKEQIRTALHRHLPRVFSATYDKIVDFYEQNRSKYNIYCDQLELNYSSWDKFIQHRLFDLPY